MEATLDTDILFRDGSSLAMVRAGALLGDAWTVRAAALRAMNGTLESKTRASAETHVFNGNPPQRVRSESELFRVGVGKFPTE